MRQPLRSRDPHHGPWDATAQVVSRVRPPNPQEDPHHPDEIWMMRRAVNHRRPAKEAHQANPPTCRRLGLPSDAAGHAIAACVAKDPDEDWRDEEEIPSVRSPVETTPGR